MRGRRRRALAENARWYPFAAIAGMWFLGSLYLVASDHAAFFDDDIEVFLFTGLSLPWGALAAAFSMREHRFAAARRFARVAIGASILLASAAIVHFGWVRPALGGALAAMDFAAIADAVEAMGWLEFMLDLQGPLLSLAAWWLLRWMELATERPPRRPGSLVRTP